MALYEDDSMVLRNPGEQAPEGYVLKGQMGPVGQEQDYYERAKSPTMGQSQQPQGMPQGGDINQFLDWAVKTKLGFNPLTFNPTTEALKMWTQKEAEYFNQTFANTGITPSSMTPDALKHWNQQKKEGLAALIQEAQQKQQTGVAYLNMLKQGWEEKNTIKEWATIGGKETALNKFGEIIQNPNAPSQMVAGAGAPVQPQGVAPQQMGQPQAEQPQMGQQPGALTREEKPKKKDYQLVATADGYVGINKDDPTDVKYYNFKKPLTAEQQNTLRMLVDIKEINDYIKRSYVDQQKSDAYTGFQGYTGYARGATGVWISGEEAEFRAQVAQLYKVVYGLSGKQINEKELQKLDPFIPKVTDSDVVFKAKVKELERTLKKSIEGMIGTAERSGQELKNKPTFAGVE